MEDRIGARIKSYRESQELSIEELAERSGLPVALLEAIESGEALPAIGPLVRIARSLGKRLGTFMDDKETVDPHIVRQDERKKPNGADAGLQCQETGHLAQAYHSLGQGKADRHMEPFFIELGPCAEENPELSSHEGEEFIIVVSGQVRLHYGKKDLVLGPGDSAYYNSIVPHHVASANAEVATIHAVLYVPS